MIVIRMVQNRNPSAKRDLIGVGVLLMLLLNAEMILVLLLMAEMPMLLLERLTLASIRRKTHATPVRCRCCVDVHALALVGEDQSPGCVSTDVV